MVTYSKPKNYLLFINTLHADRSCLASVFGDRVVQRNLAAGATSESFLPTLSRLLRAARTTLADAAGLVVLVGEGSFTGQRVGLASANALGYALGLPQAALPATELPADLRLLWQLPFSKKPLVAVYNQLPHITLPKKASFKQAKKRKRRKGT